MPPGAAAPACASCLPPSQCAFYLPTLQSSHRLPPPTVRHTMAPPTLAALLLCGLLALCSLVPTAQAAVLPTSVPAATPGFAAAAQAVPVGGRLLVTGLPLQAGAAPSTATLSLERFAVWTVDARVVLQTPAGGWVDVGAPHATAYFQGAIAGQPGSSVLLAALTDGTLWGTASSGKTTWALGNAGPAGPAAAAIRGGGAVPSALASRLVRPEEMGNKPPWHCGFDDLPHTETASSTAAASSTGSRKLLQVRVRRSPRA